MIKILKPIKKHLRVWHIAIIVICLWFYFSTFIAFLRTLLLTVLGLFLLYQILTKIFNAKKSDYHSFSKKIYEGKKGGRYTIEYSKDGTPFRRYF